MKTLIGSLLILLLGCKYKAIESQNKTSNQNLFTTSAIRKDEDFDQFLLKFSNDSAFHLSRIEFPIKTTNLRDKGKNESRFIDQDDWTYANFSEYQTDLNQGSDKLEICKLRNEKTWLIFKDKEKETLVYWHFGMKNGKWFLQYLENHSLLKSTPKILQNKILCTTTPIAH